MAALVEGGPVILTGNRDEKGQREYKVTHNVRHAKADGPATIMLAAGLPQVGSVWSFGNDLDEWAFCRPNMQIKALAQEDGEPYIYSRVTQTFNTRPPSEDRCEDEQIEDPLLEPQKVSGGFAKYLREATHDRFDEPITTSSLEQVRGQEVEFDDSKTTVRVSQNVISLELPLLVIMMNKVNNASLWGMAARSVKLSDIRWTRKTYGECYVYYTRMFEFEVDENTFDRSLADEGARALNGVMVDGAWVLKDIDGSPPDPTNPTHFVQIKDGQDENIRLPLDGSGEPATSLANQGTINVEKYVEANLLLLGIPTVF